MERKIRRFLDMSLTIYHVPPEEREEILAFVESQDLRSAAEQTLNRLFASLAISNPLEKPQEGKA